MYRQTQVVRGRKRGPGFTLVEAVIALAILQLAVLGILYTLAAGAQQSHAGDQTWRASALAADLMQEIVRLNYQDPSYPGDFGPHDNETTRSSYDDIADYNGYADGPTALAQLSGAAYPADFAGYRRSVVVANTTLTLTSIGRTVTGRTITITVTEPEGQTFQLVRFVANPAQ